MAMNAFVGAFNTTTGSSDVVVTGTGFQPSLILFWWSGRTDTVDAVGGADIHRGFGWTIGATAAQNHSVCTNADDGNTVSDSNSAHSSSACILSVDLAGAIDGALVLQSFDSNGFTLNVNDAFPRDARIHYLALGGDITNLATGEAAEDTTNNVGITAPGFTPDLVFFMTTAVQSAAPAGYASAGGMGIGCAKSSTASEQWSWSGVSQGAGATAADTSSYCLSGECMGWLPDGAATVVDGRATFVSMDANGFTVDFIEGLGTRRWHWLAIKGGSFHVDNLVTSTTLDADIAESGFGFQPAAALFASHCKVASTANTAQADDEMSVGAFSSTTARGAQGTTDDDAAGTMICGSAVEHDAVYVACTQADATAIEGLADIQSVDSDGFTLNQDDADAVAAFVGYVAFGDAATEAQTVTPSAIAAAFSVSTPDVVEGGVTLTPSAASAAWTLPAPTVIKGVVTVTPDSAVASWAVQTVAIVKGSVVLTPTPVSHTYSVQTPIVSTTGPQTVTPSAIVAAFSAATPVIVRGGIVLTPGAIAAQWAVIAPNVVRGGVTLTPSPVQGTFVTGTPTLLTGGRILSPIPVTASYVIATPTLIGGEQPDVSKQIAYWSRWLGWWWAKDKVE